MCCQGCTKRHRGCWDTCKEYKAEKAAIRKERREKYKYYRELNMVPKHREVRYKFF